MKTIKVNWHDKDGHPALAVQFPRMFPFQIEEVEQVASDLGFGIDGAGQQRAMGALSGTWSVPDPGAVISSANAVAALRAGLAKLGYEIEFPHMEVEDDGVPDWLKYETAEMGLPAFDRLEDRLAEIGRRKGVIAIESMIRFLSAMQLDDQQQAAFANGQQLYREGQVSDAYTLLRDLGRPLWQPHFDEIDAHVDRIKAEEPPEKSRLIVATWLKEPFGALRLSYPLSLSEAERLLVERLGTIFGFAVDGNVWIAPDGGEDIVAWRNEVLAAGVEIEFRDSAELIRSTHKTLELKSLDPEKVSPFQVDLSIFSETEKSSIQKVVRHCRFDFDGNILTPPNMNESYLMFRNKMRDAGFLLKIVHEDQQ